MTNEHMYACICVSTCIYTYVHTYIYTYILQTHIQMYTHTYLHTYSTYVRTYLPKHMHIVTCIRITYICMHVCRLHLPWQMTNTYTVCTYIHTYIHTHILNSILRSISRHIGSDKYAQYLIHWMVLCRIMLCKGNVFLALYWFKISHCLTSLFVYPFHLHSPITANMFTSIFY